ncbi:hypothetical protein B9Z51_17915 [Limnohabitans sp. T6-5]|uniref:chalcone isomerase family protein n=1 Tax=Limnohabitans sp. T6-5 TaxID=1100724 RepID=UPI000D3855F6|nr:chalcone isomerase family protein [Limnohabitans sp. T6-5]PUE05884.1 hypothetical protein B9Z51_17915 [Limnohabitans sp. T6-5]
MRTPLQTVLTQWHAWRGACTAQRAVQPQRIWRTGVGCAALWGVVSCAGWVQAQNTAPEFSRPEVAAIRGAMPTAPVRLQVWGFEVYDARLWTTSGFRYSQYAQHPFALELQYLRRLDGTAIASRSIDEMRRVGTFTDAQAQGWLADLRAIFPNVGPNDRITGVNQPGQGAEFWVNGQRVGVVKDAVFARLFFGIWLDERTSEPKMRAQLLQGLLP